MAKARRLPAGSRSCCGHSPCCPWSLDKETDRQQRRIARSGVVSFDKALASALRYAWGLTLSGLGATANGGGLLPLFPNGLGPGASRGILFAFARSGTSRSRLGNPRGDLCCRAAQKIGLGNGSNQRITTCPRGYFGRRPIVRRTRCCSAAALREFIFFHHLSTGAADDLVKATDTARSMVLRYGMDKNLGHVAYERERPPMLGAPMQPNQYGTRVQR